MKAITTKFHGPTNTKGSRVSAFDSDDNKVTLNWNHGKNSDENHKQAAKDLCNKLGWKGVLQMGHTKNGPVFVFVEPRDQIEV